MSKIKEHRHNVGECYRCSTTVEPIVSKQWFVKMKPLAKPAIEAVRSGRIRFIPRRFEKIYFNWMEKYKRLVHIQTVMVGPPHSSILLREMRRNHCSQRKAGEMQLRP